LSRGKLRAIKRRIKSVDSTKQITKAMQMVAAAKLQKLEFFLDKAVDFEKNVKRMTERILGQEEAVKFEERYSEWETDEKILFVFGGDRGLCGSFNHNILRKLKEVEKDFKHFVLLGTKVIQYSDNDNVDEAIESLEKEDLHKLSLELTERVYAEFGEKYSEVWLLYPKRFGKVTFKPIVEKILPISGKASNEVIYEPNYATVAERAVWVYLNATFYSVLLQAKAGEFASRMMAMKSATDNAEELKRKLTLFFNKARQASITQEILEVASGAEALKE